MKHFLLVLIMLIGRSQISDAQKQYTSSYTRDVLFRLAIGAGKSQVGVWVPDDSKPGEEDEEGTPPPDGPQSIRVGPNGKIYIADRFNLCIKVFSAKGQLQARSEGELENIDGLTVDAAGNFYTLSGSGQDTISKFDLNGKRIWTISQHQTLPSSTRGNSDQLFAAPNKSVALVLATSEEIMAILDAKGKFQRVIEASACTETGRAYALKLLNGSAPLEKQALKVSVSSLADGRALSSFLLKPAISALPLLQGSAGLGGFIVDPSGFMYLSSFAERKNRVFTTKQLSTLFDLTVTSYDPAGRMLTVLRIPSDPFVTGENLAVDAQGSLYHMEFQNGGGKTMEVVRYRLKVPRQNKAGVSTPPKVKRP